MDCVSCHCAGCHGPAIDDGYVPQDRQRIDGPGCLNSRAHDNTQHHNTQHQRVEREFLSLAGTARNCAGGPTLWNTWITCEETVRWVLVRMHPQIDPIVADGLHDAYRAESAVETEGGEA